jgi:tripeptidyl-peptidase-1
MLPSFAQTLSLLALLVSSVAAAATVTLERAAHLPDGWAFSSDAGPTDTITLSIALRESRAAELKARLFESSDPGHANYGNHLTQQQVEALREPDPKALALISDWLKSHGIRDQSVSGSWISFTASPQTLHSLLEADLAYYRFENKTAVLRARSYTVPAWLKNEIAFIHPLCNFMPSRRSLLHSKVLEDSGEFRKRVPAGVTRHETTGEIDMPCLTGTYPECIKELYGINYNATAPSPARLGIAGFLEQWVNPDDITGFMASYTPELTNLTPPYSYAVDLISNGRNDPSIAGLEASLDVEYAMAIGYPAAVTYYSTGGRGIKLDVNGSAHAEEDSDNEPYLEFLLELLARPDSQLPHVLSISYADDEQSVPQAYAERVCDLFAALAARGVTVLAASGDGGAAGTGQTQCLANDGSGVHRFVPTFPASCPYVTSVGATNNVGPPVTGATFSAGGFSNYFGRPEWQDEAVQAYIGRLAQASDVTLSFFNSSGRAVPDISAVGGGFQIQVAGTVMEVLGTSASTPVVAAMLSLVNDARLRAGKNGTGWINPLLYSAGVRAVLQDVVTGTSQGCYFPDGSSAPGFTAIEGYDAVTGLGTPGNFSRFLAAFA